MGKIERFDEFSTRGNTGMIYGGGTTYQVETPTGALYKMCIQSPDADPYFYKSTDYGLSWSAGTALAAINCTQMAVWYDYWTDPTGVLGDLIHVVYTASATSDVYYRTIDTANTDTLGAERTVFAGSSTANGGAISIARMRGGNLICCGCIDAGTEIFSRKSTDVGVNWSDISAVYEAGGNADQLIVMTGWGADTQDAMIFYYDRSASEVSVKYYDDSGNSVSEVSLAGSVSLPDHTSTTLGHISATIDHTNSANICVFWNAIDAANADLKCFSCTQAAQTAKTDVVLNSTDDQGFCVININAVTGYWDVFYMGLSDGSQIYNTVLNIYYKRSTDAGVNWGSETLFDSNIWSPTYISINPISYKSIMITTLNFAAALLLSSIKLSIPRTTYALGI